MKTNIKNKAFLLTLFLGLQPFAAMAMDNKYEEIIEITTAQDGTEIKTPLEASSWSMPEMPNVGGMIQQVVNRMVINPFHTFIDSHNGLTIPGGFLLLDNAYTNTLGNRYNEAAARKYARWLAYGLLGYKVYRLQSMLSNMQQGITNIQTTQGLHSAKFETVIRKQDDTRLELKIDIGKVGRDVKNIDAQQKIEFKNIKETQGKHSQNMLEIDLQGKAINTQLGDIEKNMATKEQIEKLDAKVINIESLGTENKKSTQDLTDMFKHFMQQSAITHSEIKSSQNDMKKLLADTNELKMDNKDILDNQAKQEHALALSLKQQEEFINKQHAMFKDLTVILNMHKILNLTPQPKQ